MIPVNRPVWIPVGALSRYNGAMPRRLLLTLGLALLAVVVAAPTASAKTVSCTVGDHQNASCRQSGHPRHRVTYELRP